ncbi:MAG: SUMF1/EgtB/PvdO family nonheme iron enzyme [Alphaproteobacteria bacterium]|nr:SUMF1/EgtB/PvdO family nonheme iron enzyme [Alphaproteobacteria bacterium]MBU1562255.1 SUMF1/EgtB/PvdO family nonheme iron enzyme [Alphaproteobacteria bacterium]MBU2302773.1 SUMF1/EgtB/PvdO family nonheme iron enzyme [Alphaproteobacteria bacterium]MBU2366701.1 SUMF1/EgtB/PvdO family nonheme iron enzyme [Alphaproteobacteria bacterium]
MSAPDFTLRVNFSHEDKEAKGLRSLRDPQAAPRKVVYFTAREAVDMFPRLLLLGPRGAGKSIFARKLADETGATLLSLGGLHDLDQAPAGAGPLILDGIDRLGPDGEKRLNAVLAGQGDRPTLLLGDGAVVRGWRLPPGFAVHGLLPLSHDERAGYLQAAGVAAPAALSDSAANPALFALALGLSGPADSAEALIDAAFTHDGDATAFAALASGRSTNRAVDGLLAARHMQGLPPAEIARHFLAAPELWSDSLASLLRRSPDLRQPLSALLLAGESDAALKAALLLAGQEPDPAVAGKLLALIEEGRLSPLERDRAARCLARWGDPRDLDALCAIPGGSFVMGSDTHPNSSPVHPVTVGDFRIGRFPVTNAAYARFIAATGRKWVSPEAGNVERSNAPATDLTWHDARAYCAWLTTAWQAEGRIAAHDVVRLPTEPEWERAARGEQGDGGDEIVYPWGLGWNPAAANSEESGLNAQCAVGLFPAGASPYGCLDMAGQVWEWTTTVWGDDMTTPTLRYPYADDGRENSAAGPTMRRVLRGGCFSSTSLKACCTYRGSLEPDGFWRGNGFRIVVAAS